MAIGRIASEGDLLRFIELRLEPFGSLIRQMQGSDKRGEGDPEGVVVGNIGDSFRRRDGGASTSFYIKEADDGLATGWQAK